MKTFVRGVRDAFRHQRSVKALVWYVHP